MRKKSQIRLRLEQIEVRPGRPAENAARMLGRIAHAKRDRIDVVAFPEMAIPGYLIGDEWERPAFLRECEADGARIREASDGIVVIFGNVGVDWDRRNEDGRVRKYNALFVAEDGRFVGPATGPYPFAIKTLLPNYREFDDSRHFFDLRKLAVERSTRVEDMIGPVRTKKWSLGCFLCEDAWDADYGVSPLRILGGATVDLFVNISCSPFTLNKNHKRNRVFSALAAELGRPIAYVNNVGIQDNGKTVFTFDGQTCVYDGNGGQVRGPNPFEEGSLTVNVPAGRSKFGAPVSLKEDDISVVRKALLHGIRKFTERCGIERVVIGVSGGIDSALVSALYSRVLEPGNLLLVNMPGSFTSRTTLSLARKLGENLGCPYTEVPIVESVALTVGQLDGLKVRSADGRIGHKLELTGPALENAQARDRSSRILAAIAAAFGGAFTCNGNKSELTVGYTTLYGDLAGYFAPIADLWKGEVYALARHLNEHVFNAQVIPEGCFTVTPSAELSAAQDVNKGLGDPLIYPYHDCLFRNWVESWNRTTPEEIIGWYADGNLENNIGYAGKISEIFPDAASFVSDLERWWNQYQGMAVAKRIQAPPVLAIKRRAFGFDHREAQTGPRYTQRYVELKKTLLTKNRRLRTICGKGGREVHHGGTKARSRLCCENYAGQGGGCVKLHPLACGVGRPRSEPQAHATSRNGNCGKRKGM